MVGLEKPRLADGKDLNAERALTALAKMSDRHLGTKHRYTSYDAPMNEFICSSVGGGAPTTSGIHSGRCWKSWRCWLLAYEESLDPCHRPGPTAHRLIMTRISNPRVASAAVATVAVSHAGYLASTRREFLAATRRRSITATIIITKNTAMSSV
jgi:hypothetical protein